MNNYFRFIILLLIGISVTTSDDDFHQCASESSCSKTKHNIYNKEINEWASKINNLIRKANDEHMPCRNVNCSCYKNVIKNDLQPFKGGITKEMVEHAMKKGTKYQIIKEKLYREVECHFPARCSGVEHYLKLLAPKLPNMELSINTRDWPQVNPAWGHDAMPVFSFSKTKEYIDIMYPAWSFWEGGPAISLYPTGIGRWDQHRLSITAAANKGVAASFRFKHLFLCKSLVFHVGDEWIEFFYPSLKPWVHYVPINPKATEKEIANSINYFKENNELAKEIAERGYNHIWDNLTDNDVLCYWRRLLKNYAKLLRY
ncbi:unnamed protein product, partial [Leptidea sinapis]